MKEMSTTVAYFTSHSFKGRSVSGVTLMNSHTPNIFLCGVSEVWFRHHNTFHSLGIATLQLCMMTGAIFLFLPLNENIIRAHVPGRL